MASGRLTSLDRLSGTTFSLYFTPPVDFASGTLVSERLDTTAVNEAAVASGRNDVTVSPGRDYLFFVVSLDSDGDYLGVSNPVIRRLPQTAEGSDWKVRWRGDYDNDWTQVGLSIDETRARIPLKHSATRGHYMQFEFIQDGQNDRLYLRNLMIEARLHGRSMGARES